MTNGPQTAAQGNNGVREAFKALQKPRLLWTACAGFLGLIALLGVHRLLLEQPETWDFEHYFFCAKAYLEHGANPYVTSEVADATGRNLIFTYPYPPASLYVFGLLTRFDYDTARLIFVGCSLAGVALLVWDWLRFLPQDSLKPLFLVFIVFAFNSTLWLALRSGNIAIFEQLGIWFALRAYQARRWALFSGLVLLVAAFKVQPVVLLGGLLLADTPDRIRNFAVAVLGFIGVMVLMFLPAPEFLRNFAGFAASVDERGFINPSSLSLIRDIFDQIKIPHAAIVSLSVYACYLGVLAWLGYSLNRLIGRISHDRARLYRASLVILLYALSLPRLKDYAFVSLVPLAFWLVFLRGSRLIPSVFLLALVLVFRSPEQTTIPNLTMILRLFYDYNALGVLALCFALLAWTIREESQPGAQTDTPSQRLT